MSCSKCGKKYGGVCTAHCMGCHETFNSVFAFDKHRKNLKCLAPESIGMSKNQNGYWITEKAPEGIGGVRRVKK